MRGMGPLRLLPVIQALTLGQAFAQMLPPGDCIFRRGDVNEDARVNIADAIAVLSSLFSGGAISCPDAADSDDTGGVDITDGVYTLSYLFLGGPPPPAPGPAACGPDPTFDRLACDPLRQCAREPEERIPFDQSGFTRFRYSVSPALGFCIEIGALFEAILEKVEGDTYRFEHSVLERGTAGDPGCIRINSVQCAVATPQPVRLLTSEEAERVRELFSQISFSQTPAAECECGFFDPCIVPHFSWDGTSASGFFCDSPRVSSQVRRAIEELLESLRPGR